MIIIVTILLLLFLLLLTVNINFLKIENKTLSQNLLIVQIRKNAIGEKKKYKHKINYK